MKVEDVMGCSFPVWYDKFNKCTIKSIVIPLSAEVLTYLQDNGTLVLPEGVQPEPTYKRDSEEVEEWDHCEVSGGVVEGPKLEEFNTKLRDAIKRLGGSVFPKLNWSSPKDASWIAFNNSLRCCTPGDVYLLLKSSSFITHDLTAPFKDCDNQSETNTDHEYCLVLRRWMEINPAFEFRCFVRNRDLIGISQRDISQSYSCIGADQANIRSDIVSFWRENIENRFPLLNYVIDVYRPAKDNVILLDFNPFGETTDGLLFSWKELQGEDETRQGLNRVIEEESSESSIIEPLGRSLDELNERNTMDSNREAYQQSTSSRTATEFRFISDATGVQPRPYMQYSLPVDILDLSTGQDPMKLVDFLQMKIQTEGDDTSDEEDVPS
ncbi:hypothetical protein Pcinc_013746 [Petrolisthes cinctipes]|uniref:Cell division cycle protein 123 homolog n=1 Tax=Petrolisthes cinctipes TaxID=88211 RepID=A0AAE1KSH0_PETCI|nr:hypothetical protein Pcinc_013746 [Petrolisthes cinctipes]